MGYEAFDGPSEEHLMREQAAAEDRRRTADKAIVEGLLRDLTPADAQLELFTFKEMVEWNITRRRKR